MALIGKVTGYVEINSGGDVLHDLLMHKPHDIPSLSDKVHGNDLINGQRGVVGSTICWHYTHDGKRQTSTQILEEVDKTNHKMVFKAIGGDVMEIYKAFKVIFHVEAKDGGKQLAAWTFEFERPNTGVPYPTDLLDYLCNLIKDMDDNCIAK